MDSAHRPGSKRSSSSEHGRDMAEGYLARAPVCPVIAWLLGRWLHKEGVLPSAPDGDAAWGVTCREEESRVLGKLVRDELSAADARRELATDAAFGARASDGRAYGGGLQEPVA